MRQLRVILLVPATLLILTGLCCKDEPTKPYDTVFALTTEDVSCTEAWLRLTIGADITPRTVEVKRDTVTLFTKIIDATQTIVVDTNLIPNHTYLYQARLLDFASAGQGIINTSALVPVQTMDTTSHAWTFSTTLLGDGSSVSYDVAIINDTLAYACGEINSGGTKYNTAKWNGSIWEFLQIQFYTFCGQSYTGVYPAKAILAFNETEIFISDGAQFTSWNGYQQGTINCLPVSVNKMWGRDKNFIYTVGAGGQIGFYNGSSWQKLESGTTVDLTDIYGTQDGKEVWTCGWNWSGGGVILRKVDNSWQKVWDRQTSPSSSVYHGKISTLWAGNNKEFVFSGPGEVFRQSLLIDGFVRQDPIDFGSFIYAMRGTARNDITIAGDFAKIWHWNGATWYLFNELVNSNDILYSIAQKGNVVIAVGERLTGGGLVIIGKR